MARLREAVDQAKCAFEEDVQKQNMEIANLKDTLLEARRASKGKKFLIKIQFPISIRTLFRSRKVY